MGISNLLIFCVLYLKWCEKNVNNYYLILLLYVNICYYNISKKSKLIIFLQTKYTFQSSVLYFYITLLKYLFIFLFRIISNIKLYLLILQQAVLQWYFIIKILAPRFHIPIRTVNVINEISMAFENAVCNKKLYYYTSEKKKKKLLT